MGTINQDNIPSSRNLPTLNNKFNEVIEEFYDQSKYVNLLCFCFNNSSLYKDKSLLY